MGNNKMEEPVIRKLLEGTEDDFRKVYDQFVGRIANMARRRLRDENWVKDFMQEFFIVLWEKRRSVASARTVDAYVLTMAKNFLTTRQKDAAREKLDRADYQRASLGILSNDDADDAIDQHELQEKVSMAIVRLPPRQRRVLELSRWEGLSIKEIARVLNLKPQTVNNHLHRALEFLRKALRHK